MTNSLTKNELEQMKVELKHEPKQELQQLDSQQDQDIELKLNPLYKPPSTTDAAKDDKNVDKDDLYSINDEYTDVSQVDDEHPDDFDLINDQEDDDVILMGLLENKNGAGKNGNIGNDQFLPEDEHDDEVNGSHLIEAQKDDVVENHYYINSYKNQVNYLRNEALERMNNAEFREILSHLELEDIFQTEIWVENRWLYLVSPNRKADNSYGAYCHACNERLASEKVIAHLKCSSHIFALNNVIQFYHPTFTYFRSSKTLMEGGTVSPNELNEAIEKANRAMARPMRDVAKNFAKTIKDLTKDKSYNKILEQLVLTYPINDPRLMFAEVSLPLMTLLNLEFSVIQNEWKPMITSEKPHPSSRFTCCLCNMVLSGLKKLVQHLSHPIHKQMQLDCLGIRCQIYDFLTKNCVFRYGTEYSLVVNNHAGEHFKDQIKEELKKTGDGEIENFEENNFQVPALSDYVREKAEALRHQKERILDLQSEQSNRRVERANQKNSGRQEVSGDKKDIGIIVFNGPMVNGKQEQYELRCDGLVGVEYVIRILKSFKNSMNQYVCTLCDKALTEARMAKHLIGYAHRIKYFETHYPLTVTRYKNKVGHMKYSNFLRCFGLVLAKLALAVEKHHGYGTVRDVPVSLWKKNREDLFNDLRKTIHASQDRGPSFLTEISNNELKEFVNNSSLCVDYTIKHEDPERFCVRSLRNYKDAQNSDAKRKSKDRSKSRGRSRDRRNRSRRSLSRSGNRRGTRTRTRSRSGARSRTRSNRRSNQRERSPTPEKCDQDVWNFYRGEVSKLASQIEIKYVDYRLNPENHPLYKTEWNFFWKTRKEELLKQGIDHRGYNFQPEWVNFFKKRLEFFFGDDLQNAQSEVRRRLNIPLTAEEDSPIENRAYESFNKRNRNTRRRNWNSGNRRDNRSRRRSRSSHSGNNKTGNGAAANAGQNENRQSMSSENKPNVIHVLRLLTAFEDHLGSIGGKIMDLLSKALTLEKNLRHNPDELEACLFNQTTFSTLETAVEKLKGILFAGLLDSKKINSFSTVIQSLVELLQYADKMGYRSAGMNNGTSNADLQRILNALQTGGVNAANHKSLSMTLMGLMGNGNGNGQITAASSPSSNSGRSRNNNNMEFRNSPNPNSNGSLNAQANALPGGNGQGIDNFQTGNHYTTGALYRPSLNAYTTTNNSNNNNNNNSNNNSNMNNSRYSMMTSSGSFGNSGSAFNYNTVQQRDSTRIDSNIPGSGLMNFDTNLSNININPNNGNMMMGRATRPFDNPNMALGNMNYNNYNMMNNVARNNYPSSFNNLNSMSVNQSNRGNNLMNTVAGGGDFRNNMDYNHMQNQGYSSNNNNDNTNPNNLVGNNGEIWRQYSSNNYNNVQWTPAQQQQQQRQQINRRN